MRKLDVLLLKLEGDWIAWIDVAQQAIEAAKHVMEETPHNGAHLPEPTHEGGLIASMGGYRRAA